MPSFAKILSFAAVAFSTLSLSSAAPFSGSLEVRQPPTTNMAAVLQDLSQDLSSETSQLKNQKVTPETVTPIVNTMTAKVQSSIDKLNSLPAQSSQGGGGGDGGHGDEGIVVKLLDDILNDVDVLLQELLAPGQEANRDTYVRAAAPLSNVLADLVNDVLALLDNLLGTHLEANGDGNGGHEGDDGNLIALVVAGISAAIPNILNLDLAALIKVLGL